MSATACTDTTIIKIDLSGVATTDTFMNNTKSLTRREGDYIWFGGKKRLWRTLSKDERKRAIHDMKEEQKNEKSFISKKKKSW